MAQWFVSGNTLTWRRGLFLPLGILIVSSALNHASAQPAAQPGTEVIRVLVARYATSIDLADTDLAAKIWMDSPEVSMIHPRGHEHGWAEVKQNFYEKTMRGLFSGRSLHVRDVNVRIYGDMALAEFYWEFEARLRNPDQPVTTAGRETQVYRRVGGTWRLIHVHYSAMPVASAAGGQ